MVKSEGYFSFSGRSMNGARSDGLAPYIHNFSFLVEHSTAVGIWKGENSSNVGCFQLFIHDPRTQMMSGEHLGNASNGAVKSGFWVWVKLEESSGFDAEAAQLLHFDQLSRLFKQFQDGGARPAIADLFHK